MPDSPASRLRPYLPEALIWSGAALCAFGLIQQRLWQELPFPRFGESLLLAGLATLIAWPLRRWRGCSWASALGMVWLLALVALTGVLPALAVALMVLAAAGLGSLLTGPGRPLLASLAGLAMIAAVVGWTLPLPVHRWWVYLPLLLLAIVLRRHALREQLQRCVGGWRDAVGASPRAAAWSVLLLGLASTGAWLPTMQYDDLAYHLGLPWQLMLHGRYALDPSHQVWALAAWAGDALQAVPQVLARREARSALDLVWLLAAAVGLWQIGGRIGLRPALRWGASALLAALPMTAALLGGMQTEAPAAAVTVALALLVFDNDLDNDRDDHDTLRRLWTRRLWTRRLWIGALLFGLLCALKSMHGVAALPLLAWAAWRHRRRLAIAPLCGAALLALLVAGSSYTYAWLVAGNPLLPLFNGVFESPYFAPVNFDDARWHAGFTPDLLWNLSFDTTRYLEGWDGGIGFVLILLAGAWLLAFFDRRARGLAICASLAMLLPLTVLQYARYIYPGMVLLLPPLLLALQRWLPARRATWLVGAACVLNLAFQANAYWLLHIGGVKRAVLALGDDQALFTRYVPERVIAAAIRTRAPNAGGVLVLSNPYYAELAGRGRTIAWYDPKLQAAAVAADADASGAAWAALLRREGISEVIVSPDTLPDSRRNALRKLGAQRELVVGEAAWWSIPAATTEPNYTGPGP